MKSIYRDVLVTQHFNPATRTAATTSTTIDLQFYSSANVLFAVGATGDTLSGAVYWTLKLTHSDDDSDYTDVELADLNNTTATVVIDSSAKDKTVYGFGYNGHKRYLRAVATPTGTHSVGTPIGIVVLRDDRAYTVIV